MRALVAWLAAASALGAAAMAADKRRARRGRGRVPEAALLALALLGGWPGEALGMLVVRHKTRKPAFLVPFALCVAGDAALLWLAWRSGFLW